MIKPSVKEVDAFISQLEDRASFLGDPALLDALAFIRRLAYGTEIVWNDLAVTPAASAQRAA
jgi:hypothetical protein